MSKTDELVEKIYQFGRLLRESIGKHGFDNSTIMQCRVLSYVEDHGTPTMKMLAGYFGITQASATSLVDRLVKKGLLERVLDGADRRVVHVRVSKKGAQFRKEKYGMFSRGTRELIESLSASEQEKFSMIIEKITKSR